MAVRSLFLAFLDLLRIMWLVLALRLLIFPDPVTLNLFFALECVFIFGMTHAFIGDRIRGLVKRRAKIAT